MTFKADIKVAYRTQNRLYFDVFIVDFVLEVAHQYVSNKIKKCQLENVQNRYVGADHSSPNVYSILLGVIFLKYTEVHSVIRLVVY